MAEATMGGESSYTDLVTCLEMARDVRALHKQSGDQKQTGDQPQQNGQPATASNPKAKTLHETARDEARWIAVNIAKLSVVGPRVEYHKSARQVTAGRTLDRMCPGARSHVVSSLP